MPTTIKAAQAMLRAIGISMRRTGCGPELRVNFRCGREETAYYTDDADDAVSTGQAMAKHRDAAAADLQASARSRGGAT